MTKQLIFMLPLMLLFRDKLLFSHGLVFSNTRDIVEFADKVLNFTLKFKSETTNLRENGDARSSIDSRQHIVRLAQQLSELTEDVENEMSSLHIMVQHGIPIAGDIKSVIREFYICVIRIEELYRLYHDYTRTPPPYTFENHSVTNLIDVATSNKYGDLTDMLYHLWRLFIPTEFSVIKKGVLEFVIDQRLAADPRITCSGHVSFQYTLHEFYSSAVASEIKGFILRAFSYAVLPGEFKSEMEKAHSELIIRSDQYLHETQIQMRHVQRDIFRCDPERHIWNVTYADFAHLFTKLMVNEIQVFPSETCSLDCHSIDSYKIHRCYSWSATPMQSRTYCQQRDCRGRMHHCEWVGSVTLCEMPRDHDSHRRYEWIESENGHYGIYEPDCPGNIIQVNTSMSGLYVCDNCMCDCVEEQSTSEATRTLSLRPQFSNIAKNMVVTGVRFIVKDNVIHIQIEEAVVLAHGKINATTRQWVALEDWVYMSNISKGGFYIVKNGEEILLENEYDYSFIRSDQRTMDLDDVTGPWDHVVTGVRFNHSYPAWDEGHNDSPIHLEIHVTPYKYSDGTLTWPSDDAHWVTPGTLYNPSHHYYRDRSELKIQRPANPILAPFNIPDSLPNQFVKFRSTDIWKDAGQVTIPFFDLQSVVTENEPLDCIGIFHKGLRGYGGFIGLRICTLDISHQLHPLTEEEVQLYKSIRRELKPGNVSKS